MSAVFRNVHVEPGTPVDEWPYEAIVTLIERGTLTDWLVLTRAIDEDPWGPVARQVEEYLGYASPYGVGPLLARAISRARRAAEARDRAEVAAEVADLITRSGLSVAALAARIGTSRSRLSTYRSGSVVPSAATMARLRATVRRLQSASVEYPQQGVPPSGESSKVRR